MNKQEKINLMRVFAYSHIIIVITMTFFGIWASLIEINPFFHILLLPAITGLIVLFKSYKVFSEIVKVE